MISLQKLKVSIKLTKKSFCKWSVCLPILLGLIFLTISSFFVISVEGKQFAFGLTAGAISGGVINAFIVFEKKCEFLYQKKQLTEAKSETRKIKPKKKVN